MHIAASMILRGFMRLARPLVEIFIVNFAVLVRRQMIVLAL